MELGSLLPFVLLGVVFWLLVIRPSQRQRAAKAAILAGLAPGVEVVTTAGIQATVTAIEDDVVVLEIADGVQVRFARSAIAGVRPTDSAPHDDPDSEDDSRDDADPSDSSDPSEPTT